MSSKKRLARALSALARERKQRQSELTDVKVRRNVLTSSIERLAGCVESTIDTVVVDDEGNFNTELYLVARTAEARLTHEIAAIEERLDKFDRNVTNPVEERLRASAVRERAVETLITKQKAVARQEQDHRELSQMDECARNRWLSRKKRNNDS